MLNNLGINIFADGASLDSIKKYNKNSIIKGFTTNPTLMRNDGISDYKEHSLKIAKMVYPKPVSFEVFSDDFDEMYDQAMKLNSLGQNVWVKIPVTNTKGQSTAPLIKKLTDDGRRIISK